MSPRFKWPLFVVSLIALNMCFAIATLVLANSDRSFAVEPDYYRKAVEWDATAAQRAHSAALAWDPHVSLAADGTITARLTRPDASPVTDAIVTVEAFPSLYSSRREHLTLSPGPDFTHTARLARPLPGLWAVRFTARTPADTFTATLSLMMPGPAARHSLPSARLGTVPGASTP